MEVGRRSFKVRNLPDYWQKHRYIVITRADGAYWFFGAYDSAEKARAVTIKDADRLLLLAEEVRAAKC